MSFATICFETCHAGLRATRKRLLNLGYTFVWCGLPQCRLAASVVNP
jgi:hypothetical protein